MYLNLPKNKSDFIQQGLKTLLVSFIKKPTKQKGGHAKHTMCIFYLLKIMELKQRLLAILNVKRMGLNFNKLVLILIHFFSFSNY
jgi:hypothetical protein